MFGLGTKEIFIIAVFALILFGPKKIPEVARNVADALRNITGAFKGESSDKREEDKN